MEEIDAIRRCQQGAGDALEALVYAPIPSGGATMTINSTLVSSVRDGYVVSHNTNVAVDSHIVQGPWIFDLPSQP